MRIKYLFIILTTLACNVFAEDYYFDATNGRDTNNGTMPETAWQSAAKFRASPFHPGDVIRFKRGEAWGEDLYLRGSGTSDNRITLTDYGTGQATRLTRIGTLPHFGKADNWTISNVEVTNTAGFACIDINGNAANLNIENVNVHDCAGRGISVQSLAPGDVDGLTIQDSTVSNNGTQGIHVSHDSGISLIKNVVIQRVTSFGNGKRGPNNLDGITVGTVDHGLIQHCVSHDNNGDGIDLGGMAKDSLVRFNTSYGNTGSGLVVSNSAANTIVAGNLAYRNYVGIHVKNPADGTRVMNNVLVDSTLYGALLGTNGAVTFKNNIVSHRGYGNWTPLMFTYASAGKLVSDYNIFWHPEYPDTEFFDLLRKTHYSYTAWRKLGYDTHSVNSGDSSSWLRQ